MKNYKYYLIVIVLIMTIPVIYKATLKERKTEYKRDNYTIYEHFYIKNNKHYYDYKISNKKEEYSFTINKNNHKKQKLIKNIKAYKEGNITCIITIYKTNINKEIYCLKDNLQVSKYILKDDDNYKNILSKANTYSILNTEESNYNTTFRNINIYNKNIPDSYKIIIWTYKGIVIISNKEAIYQEFLKEDLYDNIMATTTKRYFVLFENTKVNGIDKIHYYDLKKNKYGIYKLDNKIDKNSYINGVIEDTIYVTDRKKKKQYAINIKKRNIEEVGNEDLLFIKYEDGIKKLVSKQEFLANDQYFKEDITSAKTIKRENNYYYYVEDNVFYKNRLDSKKEMLFKIDNITEWNIYDNDLFLLKNNNIYLYNDLIGLRKLISYNELKYNYKNIYYLWK